MHDFWATDVLRVYALVVVGTWGCRALTAVLGEPRTRVRAWALRCVLLAFLARWVGVL